MPPSPSPAFDVFLSHNSRDKDAVRAIAEKLHNQGVKCWFDEWALPVGQRFTPKLAEGLLDSAACAVFFGEQGLGAWHELEQELALSLSADARRDGRFFGLIPVRLPGAPPWRDIDLPPFLRLYMWIDFDSFGDEAALRRLIAGIRAEAPRPLLPADPKTPPYVGLRPLGEKDHPIFFGRDRYVLDLLDRLRAPAVPRFTAVLGASGSGKSSLLHAGLLPRLRTGALEGSEAWTYITMRPGLDAMENLRAALRGDAKLLPHVDYRAQNPEAWLHSVSLAALSSASDGPRLILFVDQFEEVFTSRPVARQARGKYDEDVWRPFFRNLRHAAEDPSGRVHVIVAIRRDFFDQFADDPESGPILDDSQHRLVVEAMNEAELRYAIERPAVARGIEFDPGLVAALVEDFRVQPAGSLPFLQEALHRLWEQRESDRMTLKTYVAMGRLRGAVNTHAEKVIGALDSPTQALARPLFLHLVRLSDDGGADTKRRMPLADLPGDEPAVQLARRLSEEKSRLLTLDDVGDGSPSTAEISPSHEDTRNSGPTVEIAHEALLGGWTGLKQWIQDGREDRLILRRLEVAARAWSASGKEKPELLRGGELKSARRVTKTLAPEVGSSVGKFVVKSRSAERWRLGFAAVGVVLLGCVLGWLILDRRAQPLITEMRAALSGDRVPIDPYEALRQLPFFTKIADQYLVDFWMRRAVAAKRSNQTLYFAKLQEIGASVGNLSHGLPRLRNSFRHNGSVLSAVFSPDGRRVITTSDDQTARVWDAATGQAVGEPLRHQDSVRSAAFSPDGRRVVTASDDKTAQVWDAVTGKAVGEPLRHEGIVWSAAFSPDGSRVVTASADKTARVWDAATGKAVGEPLRHEGSVWIAAFSPDGSRVVTASYDQTARVWDAATGKAVGEPFRHENSVRSAAFSPDGSRVVTASDDQTARVWDAATGKAVGEPLWHEGISRSAAFSPDGSRVVTASDDQAARVWDAATGQAVGEPLRHEGSVWSAAFSPDGSRVVTASNDKTARVWDAATGQAVGEPLRHQDSVRSTAFSPDGSRVVTASEDKTARVWDVATGQAVGEPLRHEGSVLSAALSPDGSRVVTVSDDKTARVWDAATGKAVGEPLRHQDSVRSAAFSPDGRRVVTASEDKTARVWDAATGKAVGNPLRHEGWVLSAAFSPDGRRVVTASYDKTARVWDAATGKAVGDPLRHEHIVWSAAFSADGRRVVTASADKTARVWDAATGKAVGEPLRHEGIVSSAAFSPDGIRIITSTGTKLVVWTVEKTEIFVRQLHWSEGYGFFDGPAFHTDRGASELIVCDGWTPNSVIVRRIDLKAKIETGGSKSTEPSVSLAEWERRLGRRFKDSTRSVEIEPWTPEPLPAERIPPQTPGSQ